MAFDSLTKIIPDSASFEFDDLSIESADGWRTFAAFEGHATINRRGDLTNIFVRQHKDRQTRIVELHPEDGAIYGYVRDALKAQYADVIADRVDEMDALDPALSYRYDRDTAPVYL